MDETEVSSNKRDALPGMIAWFSVCLLAAAFGPSLSDNWQVLWAQAGSFGLTAALGLEAIRRVRLSRENEVRNGAARARLEQGLSRMNERSATLDTISVAVRQLIDHVASQRRCPPCTSNVSRRHWEAQIVSQYPLEIMAIDDDHGNSEIRWNDAMPGALQQVSSSAISFDHGEPMGTRLVLVTCEAGRRRLSFVVDIIWTEKTHLGYVSGGTIVVVGVPPEPQTAAELEPALASAD